MGHFLNFSMTLKTTFLKVNIPLVSFHRSKAIRLKGNFFVTNIIFKLEGANFDRLSCCLFSFFRYENKIGVLQTYFQA